MGTGIPTGGKGCKTCRIRRIKCDKAFPVCLRCKSTGRRCDGYGIWGGGSRATSGSTVPAVPEKSCAAIYEDVVPVLRRISPLAISSQDKEAFEWFRYRTLPKAPGMFRSDFWDTLLLQASNTEPAVMHGILALSSVHRCGVTLEVKTALSKGTANRFWTAGLQHYVEAINLLRRRVPTQGSQGRLNLRVIIITCVVFVCVELLRGQIDSAQAHLRSGISLLREAKWITQSNEPTAALLKSSETVDLWITEVLCRFQLHDETFDLLFRNVPALSHAPPARGDALSLLPVPSTFRYMEYAWSCADRLLLAAIYLTKDCKAALAAGKNPSVDASLVNRRQQLQKALARWSEAFDRSKDVPFKLARVDYDQSPALIQISYNTAIILTDTSLFLEDDTTIYDRHTEAFRRLLNSTAQMMRIYREQSKMKHLPSPGMSFSMFDICTLPVLYFTATRCRDIQVRRQALAWLKPIRHRECHWDGWLTYTVANKVAELEESAVQEGSGVAVIPPPARLRNQRVITTGDPFTMLSLEYGIANSVEDPRAHTRKVTLDIRSGVWSDVIRSSNPIEGQ